MVCCSTPGSRPGAFAARPPCIRCHKMTNTDNGAWLGVQNPPFVANACPVTSRSNF
jgi:hypothetical protein